ncbi:DUF1272 domain-containing protein [Rhizobium sp. YIM 134829]|uniref:DUF1272 domain-containing protein n=1 Tax=Rhizobium sp. YIM 134829 TaxID=3390453 RepID=UPI00397B294F
MLAMRPNCECCDRDLPPESPEARICSFECTFCADCVEDRLRGVCPNCGGGFTERPQRAARLLAKYPASTARVLKAEGCPPAQAA